MLWLACLIPTTLEPAANVGSEEVHRTSSHTCDYIVWLTCILGLCDTGLCLSGLCLKALEEASRVHAALTCWVEVLRNDGICETDERGKEIDQFCESREDMIPGLRHRV